MTILENEIHFGSAVEKYRNCITSAASLEDYIRDEKYTWTSFTSKAKGLTQLYHDKWKVGINTYNSNCCCIC